MPLARSGIERPGSAPRRRGHDIAKLLLVRPPRTRASAPEIACARSLLSSTVCSRPRHVAAR